MECGEIKALLSEFIDGTLDSETMAMVETHITTCKGCEEELTSLSAVVKELGALDPVKAPDDFLEKIHERMAPRQGFYRVLRTLFLPLHIKIPLELAGAATMALLVLFVLNVQQSKKGMVQGPSVSTYKMDLDREATGRTKSELKKQAKGSRPVLEAPPAEQSETEDVMVAQKSVERPVKPRPKRKFELTPSVLQQTKTVQPVRERDSMELELAGKRGAVGGVDTPNVAQKAARPPEKSAHAREEEAAYMDSAERKAIFSQGLQVEGMNQDQLAEDKQVMVLSVRERTLLKDESGPPLSFAKNPLDTVKHLVERADGNVVSVEYDRETERLKYIHAEIPGKHYASFCRELNRMAELQKPPSVPFENGLETVRIRIRFISSE